MARSTRARQDFDPQPNLVLIFRPIKVEGWLAWANVSDLLVQRNYMLKKWHWRDLNLSPLSHQAGFIRATPTRLTPKIHDVCVNPWTTSSKFGPAPPKTFIFMLIPGPVVDLRLPCSPPPAHQIYAKDASLPQFTRFKHKSHLGSVFYWVC